MKSFWKPPVLPAVFLALKKTVSAIPFFSPLCHHVVFCTVPSSVHKEKEPIRLMPIGKTQIDIKNSL